MQATSSHVIAAQNPLTTPALIAGYNEDETGADIIAALTQAAAASKRSHLLVRRRQRATRRSVR